MRKDRETRHPISDELDRLNSSIGIFDPRDVFRISQGRVLTGYLNTESYVGPLNTPNESVIESVFALTSKYTNDFKVDRRLSVGVEVGAGAAKILVKSWPSPLNKEQSAETIVDIKLQLERFEKTVEGAGAYATFVNSMVDYLLSNVFTSSDGYWLVPPENFDVANPIKLLSDCPKESHFIYLYGTQGPRNALSVLGGDEFPKMRVLSGDDEGLLVFEAIVPNLYKTRSGTMAIEIGSGSTEVVLVGHDKVKHPITFSVGGQFNEGITQILEMVEKKLLLGDWERYLESDFVSGDKFFRKLMGVEQSLDFSDRKLFMNPNKDSEALRSKSINEFEGGDKFLNTKSILAFCREVANEPYATKAEILGLLAEAFGFTRVYEGENGGLKEGVGIFVQSAVDACRSQ